MIYHAAVAFKGRFKRFRVEDCGHGKQWATTRAITYFLYSTKTTVAGNTFKEAAANAIAAGLEVTLN